MFQQSAETGFALRHATSQDADAIAALLSELGYPTEATDISSRMAAVTNDGGAVFLAVQEGEPPLGLMCLDRHYALHAAGPIAYITALVTRSTARRRGVGRAFVTAAKHWALEQGCVRISVTSAEHRNDAHAFYQACGLPYTGRRFSTSLGAPAT